MAAGEDQTGTGSGASEGEEKEEEIGGGLAEEEGTEGGSATTVEVETGCGAPAGCAGVLRVRSPALLPCPFSRCPHPHSRRSSGRFRDISELGYLLNSKAGALFLFLM